MRQRAWYGLSVTEIFRECARFGFYEKTTHGIGVLVFSEKELAGPDSMAKWAGVLAPVE